MANTTPFFPKYPRLSAPLRVGNVTLRNRMASAPMGFPYITADGLVTNEMIAFYEHRARGGASLVTVSEAYTHPTGKSHGRILNLGADGALQGLTDLARGIRRHGAVASIELNHSGMYSEMDARDEDKGAEPPKLTATEMPVELIREIVASFGEGAALVRRAGFDMVMIHGAHGWLIEQFLSPETNKRTDEYGGAFANRARIALEIIDAVRAAVGVLFPIDFRISGDNPEAIELAKLIEPKIDLIHVSAGTNEEKFAVTHPPMFAPHGVNVHFAAELRRHLSIPVATVGALNEPIEMEKIISDGDADIVCMARALLADPELPRKVTANRDDEILKCLRCFTCHAERVLTQTRVCSINPVIGRETDARYAPPPTEPKRVLVVGGGPGGMMAALTAAQRGHEVTLCEKHTELGGALLAERGVGFKKSVLDMISTREIQMRRTGVDIRFNIEVTAEFVRRFSPDAMIVAIGSEPVAPSIDGIRSRNVIFAANLPERIDEVGESVAIIGGGLVGCETAIHLAQLGKRVTILEMGARLAPDANPRHRPILLEKIDSCGIETETMTRAAIVHHLGVTAVRGGIEQTYEADTVILSTGQRPLHSVADSLRGICPVTEFVGDCVRVANIREAVFRGYHAALDL